MGINPLSLRGIQLSLQTFKSNLNNEWKLLFLFLKLRYEYKNLSYNLILIYYDILLLRMSFRINFLFIY